MFYFVALVGCWNRRSSVRSGTLSSLSRLGEFGYARWAVVLGNFFEFPVAHFFRPWIGVQWQSLLDFGCPSMSGWLASCGWSGIRFLTRGLCLDGASCQLLGWICLLLVLLCFICAAVFARLRASWFPF